MPTPRDLGVARQRADEAATAQDQGAERSDEDCPQQRRSPWRLRAGGSRLRIVDHLLGTAVLVAMVVIMVMGVVMVVVVAVVGGVIVTIGAAGAVHVVVVVVGIVAVRRMVVVVRRVVVAMAVVMPRRTVVMVGERRRMNVVMSVTAQ
ncbi:hypothetical protein [[Mycobacterium] wendilense]|uniref:Uncharacterized protein n=1 Tax=[Mycobacterium] wendilense TaxID=3064284 RepID=A0ABM9MAB0_9MYCO|nr:hypothetical protein [Mycolicibacterium sp. MU0050]CAJ1580238.1 hypothetical protein MU0050_000931 [Mycolicibacterium sp. MU0050]